MDETSRTSLVLTKKNTTMKTTKQLQFFSKWRNEWIDFKNPPSAEEMKSYREHEYKIREKKVK